MLSESEARVLKAISQGRSHPQDIATDLGMKVEAVRASADSLRELGHIQVLKSVDELFSLTEEGLHYAKEGLPERRLLQDVGAGKPISELKDHAIKIGLGWLKKKGWAVLQGGVLKPVGKAARGKDEEILDALLQRSLEGSQLDGKALAMLKSRGLVTSSKSKSWSYEITPQGREALSVQETTYGMDMKVVREMPPLSPEMIKTGAWEETDKGLLLHYRGETYRSRSYDVTLLSERIYPGKKHPYQRLIDFMREIMLEMGFTGDQGPDRPVQLLELRCALPAAGPSRPGDAGHLLSGQQGGDSRLYQRSKRCMSAEATWAPRAGAAAGARRWPARRFCAPTPPE